MARPDQLFYYTLAADSPYARQSRCPDAPVEAAFWHRSRWESEVDPWIKKIEDLAKPGLEDRLARYRARREGRRPGETLLR